MGGRVGAKVHTARAEVEPRSRKWNRNNGGKNGRKNGGFEGYSTIPL